MPEDEKCVCTKEGCDCSKEAKCGCGSGGCDCGKGEKSDSPSRE